MTAIAIDDQQRKAARIVGFTYLLAMVVAVFAESYARAHVVIPGNPLETASNIAANETLFRSGIAANILVSVIDTVLITSLYVVLRPINRNLAALAVFFRVIETAVLTVTSANDFGAIRIVAGTRDLSALSVLTAAHGIGFTVAFIFLGLGSTLFAYLWWQARYVPRVLAGLGIVGSALMAAVSLAFLVDPGLLKVLFPVYMGPIGIFEISMGLWLLFKGLPRAQRPESP
ncbi:MAG: DUF4386 domain-containing protein [Gemmatimonadota bacterium]|nr:DUF4386 domain-containing protein [Gemmatimonadota bacterium]